MVARLAARTLWRSPKINCSSRAAGPENFLYWERSTLCDYRLNYGVGLGILGHQEIDSTELSLVLGLGDSFNQQGPS